MQNSGSANLDLDKKRHEMLTDLEGRLAAAVAQNQTLANNVESLETKLAQAFVETGRNAENAVLLKEQMQGHIKALEDQLASEAMERNVKEMQRGLGVMIITSLATTFIDGVFPLR